MTANRNCCEPRTCCFGRKALIPGIRIMALIDIFMNTIVLAYLFVIRPFLHHPPPVPKMICWPIVIIATDLLLLHGINSTFRIFMLVLWQICAAFNMMVLLALVVFFSIFALPDLDGYVRKVSVPDAPK